MYISSYTRKKGKYFHMVVEVCKHKKRYCKSRSSKTSDKEVAEKMLEEFEQECISLFKLNITQDKITNKQKLFNKIADKVNMYDKDINFCEFSKSYVLMRYKAISDETYSSYLSVIKNSIIPYFFKENKKLREIEALDIQKFYFHELNVREVSPNTVIHYHNLLSLIFKYALKIGIIDKNPIFLVEKPKKEKYIGKTYGPEEIHRLLNLLKEDYPQIFAPVYITLQYGLRRSELIGLKWSAIDFEGNTLKVISTVTQTAIEGTQIITCKNKTKSIAGMRSFFLTPKTKEILLELKRKQEENKKTFGSSYCKKYEEFVFVDPIGERIKPKSLSGRFAHILKKNGLPYIRFHDLRHTAATLLYGANTNIKDIQVFLGHSSAKTTMDIYIHLFNNSNVGTVSAIDERINI
ncbi:tyrosine-type recombinase/integrase [Fusobacterium necrophorum subsp. funduliforme]